MTPTPDHGLPLACATPGAGQSDKLRILDLFSGIGGFSLGLERATLEGEKIDGFETAAFCEIEEFPRKVLAKHWPDIPCYPDVRELTAERLAADGIAVDVITGGFPCQDISFAGKGAGLAGARSGLFYEVARIIGELGPRFVILENVGALLSRGLDAVLGTLASLGYDAEWHCIPASYVGAHHRRDRVWIVAYPAQLQRDGRELYGEHCKGEVSEPRARSGSNPMANAERQRQQGPGQPILTISAAAQADRQAVGSIAGGIGDIWRTEPDVGRVAHGIPDRAHRLKGLGNAIVPQIAELLGRAILESISAGQSIQHNARNV